MANDNHLKVVLEKSEKHLISEWIEIPELGIEVQTKIHHLNKTLAVAMQDLKEGESVITYEQVQWLRNSKYRDQLNLTKTWEFVYPNPDKISADNGYVARFYASSGCASLDCYGYSDYSYSTLGVRFVRKKISK
ncbi:MAG TPA: hypothetical protein VJ438_02270 [Candidatus Nanoarchaeia archaeon]|nr:hypothetical protein [Candidatus Nanoarchaeia archaeon]